MRIRGKFEEVTVGVDCWFRGFTDSEGSTAHSEEGLAQWNNGSGWYCLGNLTILWIKNADC